MDPFSLALGVLQLTGAAIKTSSLVYRKVKVFRNYSREIGRVLKAVDRQRQNFLHQVHLLLRQAGENEEDIEEMLLDSDHLRWKSADLNNGVNKALGKSRDTCLDVVEDIGSILSTLQTDLCCFDEIVPMCAKDEPLKAAVRRLRKQVKITFDKSKFEEQIKSLRELNGDFRQLQEQAAELNKSNTLTKRVPVSRPVQLSQEFGSIGKLRRASKDLHQALAAAWLRALGVASLEDVRHNVRLMLETATGSGDRMEVIISCYGHMHKPAHIPYSIPGPLSLQVETRVLGFTESSLSTPPASDADAHESRHKRRKVRFAGEYVKEDDESSGATNDGIPHTDLRTAPDICAAFSREAALCQTSKCLGYLDGLGSDVCRHSFFQSPKTRLSSQTPVKMSEILARPVETSVNYVQQLKLARSLVLAVLKFHSTPWLQDYCSLQDLSFFLSSDGDIASCLQTAHLSLDFIQRCPRQGYAVQMEDSSEKEAIETAQLTHGVRNLTLWSLGAVLLQIGTWSTIECLDDVAKVRRVAQRVPMLGRRYGDLTKQCLECDFGFGDDLSKPRLQQAVYDNVVCGLTDMIGSLDIGDD